MQFCDTFVESAEKKPEINTETQLLMEEDVRRIHTRILENVRVLSNFKQYREEGYSRQDYINLFKSDLCKYYGYTEDIMEVFNDVFAAAEVCTYCFCNTLF